MKAVVAAFNQEKAIVGAFSVITNLRMELFEALIFISIHLCLVIWVEVSRVDVAMCENVGEFLGEACTEHTR